MALLLSRRLESGDSVRTLSASALQMDALAQEFSQIHAGHLLAMTGAGLLGKVFGFGATGLTSAMKFSPLWNRGVFQFSSLFTEVFAYRTFIRESEVLNAKGMVNDLLSFGVLRALGYAGRNANPFLSQSLQSAGLVFTQNAAAAFHWVENPEGNIAQQLVQATVLSFQQISAMALLHRASGQRLLQIERRWELQSRSHQDLSFTRQPLLETLPSMSSRLMPRTKVQDTIRMFEFFKRATEERLDRIEQRLLHETHAGKRQALMEEKSRLSLKSLGNIEEIFNFSSDMENFYLRNIIKIGAEGMHWLKQMQNGLVELQVFHGAYDLLTEVMPDGSYCFRDNLGSALPSLQRWFRMEDAPLIVRGHGSRGDFGMEERLYVNLHRIHSFQEIVGDGKIADLQASFREVSALRVPLQVSFNTRLGILGLSDGNHRARAALEMGYDFALAKYKGRLNIPQFQPPLMKDLRVVSMEELMRIIREKNGDIDVHQELINEARRSLN